MNLYHLRYFVTLARYEHYTKAAEVLSIAQPSLSHAIASLESELGVKLFEKDGRNIVLTKCGKVFLDDVKHSLSILDSSVESLQMAGTGRGIVDIGLLRTLSTNLVPELVRGFLDEYPDTNIDFSFHNSTGMTKDILQGVKDKKYDIAFCSKDDSENEIEFTPISKEELVVIVPYGHPLEYRKEVDLADTLPYPHIRFSKRSGLRPIIDSLFEELGDEPKYTYTIEEDHAVAGLVSNNFGIAVVPDIPILNLMNLRILKIKDLSWKRFFYLATLKDSYHPPVIDLFKDYCKAHAQVSDNDF